MKSSLPSAIRNYFMLREWKPKEPFNQRIRRMRELLQAHFDRQLGRTRYDYEGIIPIRWWLSLQDLAILLPDREARVYQAVRARTFQRGPHLSRTVEQTIQKLRFRVHFYCGRKVRGTLDDQIRRYVKIRRFNRLKSHGQIKVPGTYRFRPCVVWMHRRHAARLGLSEMGLRRLRQQTEWRPREY